ncbi:Protein BASIC PENTACYSTEINE1 [Abeliophyllum distichum]|uniref:GAGA-binding transcriptional activator n=1 Tax=Abeliophyllum distichum TaxID=126358 RepID=A0ABD1R9E0_9LAMI
MGLGISEDSLESDGLWCWSILFNLICVPFDHIVKFGPSILILALIVHAAFILQSLSRRQKPFLSGYDNPDIVPANGVFRPRDFVFTEPPVTHLDYVRDTWINHRDKFLHMFPGNMYNTVLAGPSGTHNSMQMLNQPDTTKETEVSIEESSVEKESGRAKKRSVAVTTKPPKAKKSRKGPSVQKENVPVCSCTGTTQQCYRWGCGGWQSACCTTTISMYPLPMSTKRRGARIAGRKMSQGAFKKALEKLAAEGYNFTNPIDLKTYWAKHGTNKFVTIR